MFDSHKVALLRLELSKGDAVRVGGRRRVLVLGEDPVEELTLNDVAFKAAVALGITVEEDGQPVLVDARLLLQGEPKGYRESASKGPFVQVFLLQFNAASQAREVEKVQGLLVRHLRVH